MDIRRLSKREKKIAIIALCAVSYALVYMFIISPVVNKWKTTDRDIRAKQAYLVKNSSLLSFYNNDGQERGIMADPKAGAGTEEEGLADMLTSIQEFSQACACYINNVKPRASKIIGQYKEIVCEIVLEADISQFSRLMYAIENPEGGLHIKRISLMSRSGGEEDLKGTLVIGKLISADGRAVKEER